MIPLGEKSKREQMILEAKINREHMKMGLEEGRKDEVHETKVEQERMKLEKAKAELEALYQKMQLEKADLKFKSEIEKTKLHMEMEKQKAEIQMDLADRQMESKRADHKHDVEMSKDNDKHQMDLHKRSSDAHMNQQLKYHSAKAKAKSDPEAPHDVPELELRDIPKPQAFRQGTPSVFNPGNSGYEQGTKSIMTNTPMPNFAMSKGFFFGIDEVLANKTVQQNQAQIQQRVDSSGKPIPGNYSLATTPKPQYSPSTATLATAQGPQQRWEAEQARKAKRGYEHGGAIPHPMTGQAPTNPEAGPSDTVPAMLTPGEAVIPREAAQNPKNKPIIDKLIMEGRMAQKGHTMPDGKQMAGKVHKFGDGSNGVPGYVAGTQSVADTDVFWSNQGESALNEQTEEELKRRREQQANPVQNADGSSQAMGVPPVPSVDPKKVSIDFSSQKVERPTHAEATPDRVDTNQPTPEQRLDQRVVDEEASMGAIPKPEEGWGSKIDKTLGSVGGIFGLNAQEVKRMAAQAAAAKLMGYDTRSSINAGFRGASQQAQGRVAEEHKVRAEELADKKLVQAEELADKRLKAKSAHDTAMAEAKDQKTAYQTSFKEEYSRLTKEEFLPEHEARAKADAYAKQVATGRGSAPTEGGPAGQAQVRQGQYLGQPLVGQYAHAPSKPGQDIVVTDPKTMKTAQIPTHVVKVRGVDTPFVNVPSPDGGYQQVPLQEFKQGKLNSGFGIHEMSSADTVAAKAKAAADEARARQGSAIQLAGHNMSVRAEGRAIDAHGRAIETHKRTMTQAEQSQQDHAIKTIKANLPEFIAGTTEKNKGNPDNQVNRDKIANGVLQTARELKIDPNNPAFIHMVEQTGTLIANDSKLAKTVSPEGVRRALMSTIVSGLPDGGHLVQPVNPKAVTSGDRKLTSEEAQKQVAAQIAFGGVIDYTIKSGKAKDPGQAFGILQQDWTALTPKERDQWTKRAEGSGMTGFMYRANNL